MVSMISFVIAAAFLILPAHAQEVQNIALIPHPQPDGSFVVDVTWEPPADAAAIAHYQIYQIQGQGEGISQPQTLPADISAFRITNVPAVETLGVSIQVAWKDGHISHGAFASLGSAPALPPSPLLASVSSPLQAPGLSREDLGMVLFVVLAGAVVGTMSVRLFHRA